MKIHTATYLSSYVNFKSCPDSNIPEYAFIGRSNVGKSSLINYITDHQKLAKVSGTPGKTQCINFFEINANNEPWHLVDLPGYGYAKTSKKNRKTWEGMIKNYLELRPQLTCVFQLVDGRIAPQKIDLEFCNWMGEKGIPIVRITTKVDKPGKVEFQKNIQAYDKELKKMWEVLPLNFVTSSSNKIGGQAILDFIDQTNKGLAQT